MNPARHTERNRIPTRGPGRWTAVVVAGLVLAACSGDGDKQAGPSTSSTTEQPAAVSSTGPATTATTAPPVPDDQQQVLTSYRAFWDAYIAASNPMNPEHPALADHAAYGELDTVRRTLLARRSAGEVFKGTMDLAPKVTALDGDRATVRDCHDDNLVVVDAASGAVKEPDDPVRKLVTVTLVRGGPAGWKVTAIKLESEGCSA
jgi:hypothetical protein